MSRHLFLSCAAITMSACAYDMPPAAGDLRTPDRYFDALPDYAFKPNYVTVDGHRLHYVDEGPRDGEIVLLMHGEPSWSYLYRHMIPPLVDAGFRVIAPDLIGFGKSDKPGQASTHSYQYHVDVMSEFVRTVDIDGATLFAQDWGGLIGLRVLANEPERFNRVIAANTALPASEPDEAEAGYQGFLALVDSIDASEMKNPLKEEEFSFPQWAAFAKNSPAFNPGDILQAGTLRPLSVEEVAAYNAPFPDDTFMAGPRTFPSLVPSQLAENHKVWTEFLANWDKPFLTAFSDSDPVTAGEEKTFQSRIPGAQGLHHRIIEGGGHFLQEDNGDELANLIIQFIKNTPSE